MTAQLIREITIKTERLERMFNFKSTYCSSKESNFSSQHPCQETHKHLITPVPEELKSSSSFCRYQPPQNTYINNNKYLKTQKD